MVRHHPRPKSVSHHTDVNREHRFNRPSKMAKFEEEAEHLMVESLSHSAAHSATSSEHVINKSGCIHLTLSQR